MKKQLFILLTCFSFILASCDIDQTKSAELPEVDVDVDTKAGQLPAFDVQWADVNVGTRTETVKVPKIKVIMEEEEIEIPYIDVDMPGDGEREERTIVAEAQVSGMAHKIDIVEVYATGNRLYVISELKTTDQDLGDETMRVTDRLTINAPEDLDVKHYIIGTRPGGQFNRQYTYVSNRDAVKAKLVNGKQIYKK